MRTGSLLAVVALLAALGAAGFAGVVLARLRAANLAGQESERSLARAERRFQVLVHSSGDAVTVLDPEGRFSYAGPASADVLAVDADDLVGMRLEELVDAEDVADCRERLATLLAGDDGAGTANGAGDVGMRWEARGGRAAGPVWLEFSARSLDDEGVLVCVRDVTEHRIALDEVAQAAAHDHLTGLKTRREFLRQASRATATASAESPVAVLFCDLDGFSGVNDVYGRAAGDEVLRAVAARLRRVVRPQELVGRIGGDEFAVLLPGPVDNEALSTIADRLQSAVAPAITLRGGGAVRIGMSIGQALVTSPTPDAEALLPYADQTMRAMQTSGRFTPSGS